MGSSEWFYVVPYQPNIQQVLDDLRDKVFAEVSINPPQRWWAGLTFEEAYPPIPGSDLDEDEYLREHCEWLQHLPDPTTIEAWLEWHGEEGTHSILDVERVIEIYHGEAPFTVSPLTNVQLMSIFGTPQPNHNLIVEHKDTLSSLRERWEGIYVIVYQDQQPHEIFFYGFSGD